MIGTQAREVGSTPGKCDYTGKSWSESSMLCPCRSCTVYAIAINKERFRAAGHIDEARGVWDHDPIIQHILQALACDIRNGEYLQ